MQPIVGTHNDDGLARCLDELLDGNDLALEQNLAVDSRDIESTSHRRRNGFGAQGYCCGRRLCDLVVDDDRNDPALRQRQAFESHHQRSAVLRPRSGEQLRPRTWRTLYGAQVQLS